MAAKEPYDFVSTVAPDYNYALGIPPQGIVTEDSVKNQVAHLGADGSEEVVTFGSASIFFIAIGWNILSESNAGTAFDWYNDPAKANGIARSFKYVFGDGHTYVVKFASAFSRVGSGVSRWGAQGIRLKIIGRISDT